MTQLNEKSVARYEQCMLCPRACGVNRYERVGVCGANEVVRIGRAALHWWEEPCLVGEQGSGAIFFSHCSLGCVYCQNKTLAEGAGIDVTADRLAEIMLELQNDHHAANINLVTATHYAPTIAPILRFLKNGHLGTESILSIFGHFGDGLESDPEPATSKDAQGVPQLTVPVVWNTSGYECGETLALLEGLVDIYLVDFKYANAQTAQRLSHAADYSVVALEAIQAMFDQVGEPEFDESGLLRKGVIVRHLVLPGYVEDSLAALELIHERFGNKVLVSIMNQFTIVDESFDHAAYGLERAVSDEDYERVLDHADALGIEDYFWQEGGAASGSFVPAFDGTGVVSVR